MQVGRGGKARGGRRGARSGRGGGGRGAQKRLPELEEWVPSYALREHWPSTTGLNSFAGTQPLPERCKGERLRPADVSHKGPNGSPSGECFQLDLRGKNETQPVLPTLFVPGFPKSATTWLWDCMHAAYLPEVVCRDAARTDPRAFRAGFDPRRWSKAGCSDADGTPRRFMLPGTACNVLGGCQHRKELFFYGGGFGNYFANGLASLHGPEVRRPPRARTLARTSAEIRRNFGAILSRSHTAARRGPLQLPLEMFANREMAPRGVDRQTYDGFKLRRMGTFCTDPVHTHLPPNRTHPSCCVATSRKPKFWGCRWHDTLRVRHGHSELMWFQTAMPWVKVRLRLRLHRRLHLHHRRLPPVSTSTSTTASTASAPPPRSRTRTSSRRSTSPPTTSARRPRSTTSRTRRSTRSRCGAAPTALRPTAARPTVSHPTPPPPLPGSSC